MQCLAFFGLEAIRHARIDPCYKSYFNEYLGPTSRLIGSEISFNRFPRKINLDWIGQMISWCKESRLDMLPLREVASCNYIVYQNDSLVTELEWTYCDLTVTVVPHQYGTHICHSLSTTCKNEHCQWALWSANNSGRHTKYSPTQQKYICPFLTSQIMADTVKKPNAVHMINCY